MEASSTFGEVIANGPTFFITHYGKFFAVYQKFDQLLPEETPEPDKLICVCVYKVGALEVKRRLEGRVVVKRKVVLCKVCRRQPGAEDDLAEIAAEPDE